MVDFRCPECNICFVASHQCDGHHRSVHRSTCKIRTATGRITVNRSIDGKYLCPVEGYTSTFERSDTLQRHFKGRHAEQSNSALNQHLNDDAQIRAMSMGMLIKPPIEQTPELLRDVGLTWRAPKSRGETHLRVPQSQVAESWNLEARSRLPTLERGRGSSWEPKD